MEPMRESAQEYNAQGLAGHQRALESWISAGVLTPKEINEARRVLHILREREKSKAAPGPPLPAKKMKARPMDPLPPPHATIKLPASGRCAPEALF